MKKYRNSYSDNIEEVEVKGETAKFVILPNGRREAKMSEWRNYFDSWEGCHNFLVEKYKTKVESASANLERLKGDLGRIKGMKHCQEYL